MNLEKYYHATAGVRRGLMEAFQSNTYGAIGRIDAAKQLVKIIRKGGGPGFCPEYTSQLTALRRGLEHFNPVPTQSPPSVPSPGVLKILAEIAEMEAETDGQET